MLKERKRLKHLASEASVFPGRVRRFARFLLPSVVGMTFRNSELICEKLYLESWH